MASSAAPSKALWNSTDFHSSGRMLHLGPERKWFFIEQLQRDVQFLDRAGMSGYSLLLACHETHYSETLLPTALPVAGEYTPPGSNRQDRGDGSEG